MGFIFPLAQTASWFGMADPSTQSVLDVRVHPPHSSLPESSFIQAFLFSTPPSTQETEPGLLLLCSDRNIFRLTGYS
jgi:hypothetical protein